MSLQSEPPYGNGRQREVAIEDTATLEPAGWRLSWCSVFGGALAGALGQFGDRVTQSLPQRQTQTTPPPTQSPNPAEAIKQATPPQREAARKAVSSSALASFVALLFGAVAAGFAGRRG